MTAALSSTSIRAPRFTDAVRLHVKSVFDREAAAASQEDRAVSFDLVLNMPTASADTARRVARFVASFGYARGLAVRTDIGPLIGDPGMQVRCEVRPEP